MPLTLPNLSPPSWRHRVHGGKVRLYIAGHLPRSSPTWPDPPASGLGALAYLGEVQDGVSLDGSVEYTFQEGEEATGPVEASIASERYRLKATLVDLRLETWAIVRGSGGASVGFGPGSGLAAVAADNFSNTGGAGVTTQTSGLGGAFSGSTDGGLAVGTIIPNGRSCVSYWQVVLQGPARSLFPGQECNPGEMQLQLFKAVLRQTGPITWGRRHSATLPIEIEALFDEEVETRLGQWGPQGRIINTHVA